MRRPAQKKEKKLDQDVRCYHVAGLEDLERDPSRSRAATDPKPTESQSRDETTETL